MRMTRMAAAAAPAANVAQFTGSYLNRAWTRRYILGTLLQNYQSLQARLNGAIEKVPSTAAPSAIGQSAAAAADDTRLDVALLQAQRVLAGAWKLPVRPLDGTSEKRIGRLLANYACGEGQLSNEALEELEEAFQRIPGAPENLADPRQMEVLLTCVGFVKPGDNLRRAAYAGQLHYPPQALSFMESFLSDKLQHDGGDPYDALREVRDGPGYAIDSATTSEVDDAIGVEVDTITDERYFVVYVSDATVYCPYDSLLEAVTARALTTTTYLPEGVYFMLPKRIVEAATLRTDRPCRTFNIRFKIDETTGELQDYSVHVGWLKQLRRITYDQVQALLDDESNTRKSTNGRVDAESAGNGYPAQSLPTWLTPKDVDNIKAIYEVAKLRLCVRLQRAVSHQRSAIDSNLPEPLIQVQGTSVVSVTDQIISTQDARLAVAELMIAANEACSRVAQAHNIPIPHRGTRAPSGDHEAALEYSEPPGVTVLSSLDTGHLFMAEAMRRSIQQLSSVTRALYAHTPLYHAGLDTTYYTHSTSPLRRYADMLVHHQLKVWLWREGRRSNTSLRLSSSVMTHELIPEYNMASLCTMISTKQEQSAILQDGSSRYWLLRYLQRTCEETKRTGRQKLYKCLVGETRRVLGGTEYSRVMPSPDHSLNALIIKRNRSESTSSAVYTHVSEVYLPELQLSHTLHHSRADVVVGAVVTCRVTSVHPTQGLLGLEVVQVSTSADDDERAFAKLLRGGVVAGLDA